MTASAKTVVLFAISTGLGIVSLVLGCALEDQWLLLVNLIPIIFAAVPALLEICSSPSRAKQGALADPFASSAAKAPAVRWDSFGRFFVGSMWATSFALPFVLWHASQVSGLLLGLSLASVALFLLPIIIYEACGPPPAASEGFGTSLYGSH